MKTDKLKTLYPERYFFAGIIVIIGFIVMLGWKFKLISLIQIHPSFVPMQFNTALCFSLIGISLLLISTKLHYFSSFLALLVLIISTVTLIEYIFHINIGIDELLIKHYVLTETSHPGRMAPNTALCFLLSACIIILYNHFQHLWFKITCICLLFVIGLLGFLSVIGYLFSIRAIYSWGNLTGMAIHTGFSFFIITLALFRLLIYPHLKEKIQQNILLPALVGGFSMTFILLSWQLMEHYQHHKIKLNLYKQLSFLEINTSLQLKEKISQTEDLFVRLSWLKNYPFNLYRNAINQYINLNPSLLLITQNTLLKNQKTYLNFHLKVNQPNHYIDHCIKQLKPTRSPHIINVALTKRALCIYQKKHNLLAIYQLNDLFNNVIKEPIFNHFGILIYKQNLKYFEKDINESNFYINQWQVSKPFNLLGELSLTAKLWPSETYVDAQHDEFLIIYFLFGMIITIFFVITIRNSQLIYIKNKHLNQKQRQLEMIAYNDFLTGIPNRLKFRELAIQSIFRAQRHENTLALLFLDLDGFKPINDNYGHDMGDLILKELSLRFSNTIRTNDTVARIGGDEFAIILEDANFDGAKVVAEKLIESTEKPFKTNGESICLSTSIGIAIYPANGTELDQLFKYADIQLYKAKSKGKGQYYPS
ncbi:GGDEF domain-containing protein [Thiotrichales bacterium 19X7-9]|nr:GGDEF domain-containing protein [Thiotrichales bacterium 19X7-9]